MSGTTPSIGRGPSAAAGGQGRMAFQLLGPLRVVVDGAEVPITSRRQRALLALLLMNVGRVVPTERLIDQLWDGAPPPQALVTLRSYVSNVRQALGPSTVGGALVTRGPGYALDVPADTVDAVRLSARTQQGREHLRHGRPQDALAAFDAAIGEWNGDPLAEIADHRAAQSTIAQLTETYLGAVEGRFEALLGVGRHLDALPGLEAFAADHPLREGPRALLMQGLYRAGRAPEALDVHRQFRVLLDDELGIDPSPVLDDLLQRILGQDPSLAAPQTRDVTVLEGERPGPAAPPAPDSARPDAAEAESHGRSPAPGGPAAIVGRSRELELIRARLDALSANGTGGLLLLAGEPGIGKTTLLEALERQAGHGGIAVHRGRSPAATGAPAFWPWLQVIESMAAGLDDDALRRALAGSARPVAQLSATIAERTGRTAPILGDDLQTLRFLLYEAVSAFVQQTVGDRPIVITLDDLHWADLPSLELLAYLTPSTSSRPLLLAATYRNLPADSTEALIDTLATVAREEVTVEISLTGLAVDDVARLTDDLLAPASFDQATRTEFASLVHMRTGGNPFFVRQLGRLMVESGTDPVRTSVPPGVRHVIARRLKALPPLTGDLLAAAAVVGRDFDPRMVAAVAGVDIERALDAYDDAVRHGVLESSGAAVTCRFVHVLVQEVLLEQLPAGRRARLHADVAAQLQRGGGVAPEEVAEHVWLARDIVGADAVAAQLAAATASMAVFAHERADAYLRRALQLTDGVRGADPQQELAVLLTLVRLITAVRGWGDEEVRALVDRSLRLTQAGGLDDTTARLWWSIFFFLLDRDDPSYVDVVRTLDAMASDADEAGGRLGHAGRAAIDLAGVLAELDRDDRRAAGRRLAQARLHVEAAPNDSLASYDEHLHVMLLLIEGYWAALHGDAERHRKAVDAAVALADADGRPFPRAVARTLGAAAAVFLCDPASYVELTRAARELSERFGFGWLATLASYLSAWAEAHAAPAVAADGAVELIQRVLQGVIESGRRGNISILALSLADVLTILGRVSEAREALLLARAEPGSYRGLVIDLVDRRLAALG